MTEIRYAEREDEALWRMLDRFLPEGGFAEKVRTRTAYVLCADGVLAGVLRYHLFWDEIPFCSLLFVREECRGRGYGKALLGRWEEDMRARGYDMLLTSSRADESAQHFFRKAGYGDCGGLLFDASSRAQPTELFFRKQL